MKKYTKTNLYNWEVLRDNTHIFWCHKIDSSGDFNGFIEASYYPDNNHIRLEQAVYLVCDSLDDANIILSKMLKAYRVKIPEEFQGRYFKLKKLQKFCQKVS